MLGTPKLETEASDRLTLQASGEASGETSGETAAVVVWAKTPPTLRR